jgi:hypothetical protein
VDSKSLDEIMSSSDDEQQAEQPSPEARDRDEQGRFAAKATEQLETPDPSADGPQSEPNRVPQQALHAAREKAREKDAENEQLRREMAELRGQMQAYSQMQRPQHQEKPSIWENPDEYLQSAINPIQQRLQQNAEQFSLMLANDKHGPETVQGALETLRSAMQSGDQTAVDDYRRIMSNPHPYGELVAWHQRRQTMQEIGDPAAYREKVRAELMAELQASQAAPAQQQPAVNRPMPTSFASARNEGQRAQPTYSGPRPLSEIMDR